MEGERPDAEGAQAAEAGLSEDELRGIEWRLSGGWVSFDEERWLLAEVRRLRAVVEYYADDRTWDQTYDGLVYAPPGAPYERARAALDGGNHTS